MTTKMKKPGYHINYTTNTITVSKRFLEEASVISTVAFNTMKELRQMNMAIIAKEPVRRRNNRITYAQMVRYISIVENSGEYLERFEAVKAEARSKKDSYTRVLTWFRETFPHFYDMPTFNEKNEIVVHPSAPALTLLAVDEDAA